MSQSNIPAAGDGDPLITKSIANVASDINGFAAAAVPAGMMNAWAAGLNASIFNEAGLTAANAAAIFNEAGLTAANAAAIFNEAGFSVANKALVFNEAGFSVANKALAFREAGLSIANINAIIIHANITDDNAQQILSEITKANRDLTSADNIYELLDDWDDNKLTSRDGAGTTSTGFTNLFAQKNKFRPEWTQTGTDFAVVSGVLQFRGSSVSVDYRIEADSTFAAGTWEIGYTRIDTPAKYAMFLFMATDYDNSNALMIRQNADTYIFSTFSAGAQTVRITGTWSNDGNPHTFKVTRDASNNFEIFEDNVSKGTVTDATHTTSAKIIFGTYYSSYQCDWDNLKVY